MTDEPQQEWWSAAEIADAGLPDLPSTKRKVNQRARDEGWDRVRGKVRRRKSQGGGFEYHYSLFPTRARLALLQAKEAAPEAVRSRDEAWADFEKLNDAAKSKGKGQLAILQGIVELEIAGLPRAECVRVMAEREAVSERSVWLWLKRVQGVPEADWLAYLARKPVVAAAPRETVIDPEFLALVKSDWLRNSAPSLTSCYDRTVRVAEKEGLGIVPLHTVRRVFKKTISKPTEIYFRKGAEALKQYYPHQTRNKNAMVPLECICGDYHKFDDFVEWPGEALPVRPQGVFFSDVYSGKLLAWRLSLTANSHTVQLVLGDVIETYGIPQSALLDNGREFASKVLTGGAESRFRFEIRDDDIPGLLPTMGVKVHWATPYSGQSKPIERSFRDLCDRVAKHPEFEGAYTGNKPDAKPENYRSRAVPLADFVRVLSEEVHYHNARTGRRSEVANGRSFDEVFNEGYKTAPIRKATEEQRRLWLLGAEGVKANAKNGEIKVYGSRFWSEWMYQVAGQKIVARFDPDNLHKDAHIYALTGEYLGPAKCVKQGDFLSVDAAKEVARKRNQFIRASRDQAKAERIYKASEIAARQRAAGEDVTATELPEAEIVQMVPVHPKAAKPQPKSIAPSDAGKVRPIGTVSRIEDRLKPVKVTESDEEKFNRAKELEPDGVPVSAEQQRWLENFQKSAVYRTQSKLRAAFGEQLKR